MKTQTSLLVWGVAVCVMWTLLYETAKPSQFVPRSEENNSLTDQNDPLETAEPSVHGKVEATELLPMIEAFIAEESPDGAKATLPGREYLLNGRNKDEMVSEYRFSGILRDCEDLRRRGHRRNGVYIIRPDRHGRALKVYCDMTTDGGGWTVIQRRQNGSENFYRPWNSYVEGFGNILGEFFLGLDTIQQLTIKSNSELRVDLEEFSGSKSYAKYSRFGIGNSASKYALTVSGYSGNAGDSLIYHNGMKFSTYDQDNDPNGGGYSCAQTYRGAWWYNSCHQSGLNGDYLGTSSNGGYVTSHADGVVWYHLKNSFYYSVKSDVMMVRRT